MINFISMGLVALLAMAPVRKEVTFLGFSENEKACAWQVNIKDRKGKIEYSWVNIAEVESNEIVATFRNSKTTAKALDDPHFAKAQSQAAWTHFKRQANFWMKPIPMDEGTVRLAVDDDTQAALHAAQKEIVVEGEMGSPVGFRPVTYLVDGKLVSLGHYRIAGAEGHTIRTTVEVYRSKSAFRVAVLNKFKITNAEGQNTDAPMGAAMRLSEVIGSTSVGGMNMLRAHLRVDAKLLEELAPGTGYNYDW
jgi:hypothetical protein